MGFRCKSFSLSLIIVSGFSLQFVIAVDTITSTQFVKDSQEITSDNGRFKLGFFCPPNSTNRYVGIWYMSKSIILWVANRNQPLKDSSGIFTISEDGNLVVLNGLKEILWSTNVSNNASIASAQLWNSGNLVLKNKKTGVVIWESFQHPSDTFLAQMKFTTNKRTGEKLRLTSWRSPSDPSIGNFSVTLEALNVAEEFIWRQSLPYWRSGPWNGRVFLGIPEMKSVYNNGFNVGEDDGSLFLTYNFGNQSKLVIYVLNSQGQLEEVEWNELKMEYVYKWINAKSECDIYGICGAYGSCDAQSSHICSCLRGFEPRDPEQWNVQNWSRGCVRRTALECEKSNNGTDKATQDEFLLHQMVKVPAFLDWSPITEELCRIKCLKNCSCTAYAYDAGVGCMYWTRSLFDIQKFSSAGVDLYVRVAYSEFDKKKDVRWIILISALSGACIAVFCTYMFTRTCKHSARKKGRYKPSLPGKLETYAASEINVGELTQAKLPELPVFEFVQIATATNNFHLDNKLGQGGFGPVYKGQLQDGQQIAVKRLSRASGQGIEEFMNEVTVISNLQHRNLVRLIGCCIERGEKILIYEYMRNKSLDEFIFDPENQKVLDWTKRFSIIGGIARGLLYLHRDSRLRIIHRDLKASNILLDDELNPKISDFGMARIFGGTENEVNTRRIVGTYGYMPPEFAMEGLFSEKSDVFSFGVLLLEIISGRRNSSFYNDARALSLLGYAWKLWKEDNVISLITGDMYDPNFVKETLRGIHTALLCVQEQAKDRPNMSTVISMLNGEIASLPPPKQPAFILRQAVIGVKPHSDSNQCSNNNVTMTSIHGR